MTRKEFGILAKTIKTFYPDKNILTTNEELELWYEMLNDIPYEVAVASVKKWVSLNKWCPTVAGIRELSSEFISEKLDESGEAWELVLKAVRNFGQYRTTEALDSLPPLVSKVVKQVGFKDICLSQKIGVERSAFCNLYMTELEKMRRENILSKELKTEINQMSSVLRISEKETQ